ncbi:hypothetical protein Tco_1501726, partial [Tanacetum coccineum]
MVRRCPRNRGAFREKQYLQNQVQQMGGACGKAYAMDGGISHDGLALGMVMMSNGGVVGCASVVVGWQRAAGENGPVAGAGYWEKGRRRETRSVLMGSDIFEFLEDRKPPRFISKVIQGIDLQDISFRGRIPWGVALVMSVDFVISVDSIRRIQGIGYGVLEFLGVGTMFDIFQNLHILYLQYGILSLGKEYLTDKKTTNQEQKATTPIYKVPVALPLHPQRLRMALRLSPERSSKRKIKRSGIALRILPFTQCATLGFISQKKHKMQ